MYFTQLNYQKHERIFLLLQTSVGFKTPCACSLVHLLAPLGNHLIKGISAPEHLAAASTAANLVKFVYRVWEIHFQVFHLSDFESLHCHWRDCEVTQEIQQEAGSWTWGSQTSVIMQIIHILLTLSLDESWKKVFQQEENNLGSLQRGKNMLIQEVLQWDFRTG